MQVRVPLLPKVTSIFAFVVWISEPFCHTFVEVMMCGVFIEHVIVKVIVIGAESIGFETRLID